MLFFIVIILYELSVKMYTPYMPGYVSLRMHIYIVCCISKIANIKCNIILLSYSVFSTLSAVWYIAIWAKNIGWNWKHILLDNFPNFMDYQFFRLCAPFSIIILILYLYNMYTKRFKYTYYNILHSYRKLATSYLKNCFLKNLTMKYS